MLSVISRAPGIRSRPLTWSRARALHVSPVRSSGHGAYTTEHAVPFSFKNRPLFATKVVVFLGFGFALPFIAGVYHINKK
ncbi:uncharacterized protein ARMOST_05265 [Armillaria ostoyae]|uniref:Cytochrome c oxidase subunit 8, mitochondrial n=2 Tax=Armillaria TaxID=47424 RepID=A0A284QZQ5_ARMOS|nr:hypothetical protein EDD85DRAFT_812326 [Armillaria nabsnona]PBL02497.1 hypothetical protein ARMGADRAFT_1159026 [Armillaria gallica]SJL01941.1 uncharacterized protein ARMOST_05265 [Armillaria ostoyae]